MTQSAQTPSLREWLQSGPFALGLSSGFFGFFAHSGMISVLEEEELFPARLSGSSAGALVAGAWASGVDAREIADVLLRMKREDFWDPFIGLGLLRGRRFRKKLESLLPVDDFKDCRWPLAVSTFDLLTRSTRVIDSGSLAKAIHAACAVPLMFQPVWMGLRPQFDGGLTDRHGIAAIEDGQRLFYHHLSSRSPWRRKNSAALRPPERANTVSLIIEGLPRVGPFRLPNGRDAYQKARRATYQALDSPVVDGIIRV